MVNRRSKGHEFERWVSKYLKRFFPFSKRHLEYQVEECKGVDLDNTEPFGIQCKRRHEIKVYNWLEEIKDKTAIPILIAKADRKKPIIAGYLEDLAHLVFDPKLISMLNHDKPEKIHVCDVNDSEE